MKDDKSFVAQIRAQPEYRASLTEQTLSSWFPNPPGELTTDSDPTQSGTSQRRNLARSVDILYGRVVDAIAYTGWYKVQLERGGGVIPCCDLVQTGLSIVGARQLNTYKPGDGVYVLYHPQAEHGIIFGSAPDFMLNPQHAISDMVSQGSNTGLNVDYVHQFPFQLSRKGGITDWSAGRPFDSLPIGAWGAMSDTGLGCYLDSYMAYLRADEETGLFLFYRDQLARLAGHNLQVRSAGHMREDYDDEQEFDHEAAWTGYLWEARGAFKSSEQIYRPYGPKDMQNLTQWYSGFEPVFDDQQPIHRHREFKGYFGQGQKRTLYILPEKPRTEKISYVAHLDPSDPDAATPVTIITKVERFPRETIYRNVSEENWDTDGNVAIRSAKGVIIAKRMLQPAPKRVKLPEDPAGDNSSGYKASGAFGSGPDHKVGDIKDVGTDDQLVHAAAFMDAFAHCFNWKGLHQFHYHKKDWYLPQEGDMEEASKMADGIPDFNNLACQQYLPRPTAIKMTVDDRYGQVMYFPNNSYLALLDDGGVLLGDGWGSELRMTGGSIFETCPGDHWVKSGKNSNVFAGMDAIVRANGCVEISANLQDVRIKADHNVYILGGNELCGGVLIESRAPGIDFKVEDSDEVITGVLLKAPKSIVAAHASTILLTNCDSDDPGMIILDAGTQQIVEKAKNIRRHIDESAIDYIGGAVNEFWENQNILGAQLDVYGPAFIKNCLMVNDNILAKEAVVGAKFSQLTIDGENAIEAADNALSSRIGYLLGAIKTKFESDPTYLQENTDICTVDFFFRTSDQYRTFDFVLFEDRWQQMARLASVPTKTWNERPVSHMDELTYPYPGKQAWTEDENYAQIDLNLFDMTANYSEDRGSVYESPSYADPDKMVLDDNYTVIADPCESCD